MWSLSEAWPSFLKSGVLSCASLELRTPTWSWEGRVHSQCANTVPVGSLEACYLEGSLLVFVLRQGCIVAGNPRLSVSSSEVRGS